MSPAFIDIKAEQAVNMRLGEVEFAMGRAHLKSMPQNLGIVLGNGCNIDCPHCYQLKNGDNLLRDTEIGFHLRQEFATMYPFLSTVRIQGGEVFALKGFEEIVDDIEATVDRPLISISTNATMISEAWAERIVKMPFQHLTVSIDAAKTETYAKVRRGGNLDDVIENIERINQLKLKYDSPLPTIDSFYVVMRSNFREIPLFLDLLAKMDIYRASFQTMLIDERNLSREPWLVDEVIKDETEIRELRDILVRSMEIARSRGQHLVWSGFIDLFEGIGLNHDFLSEAQATLMPSGSTSNSEHSNRSALVPQYKMPPLPELPDSLSNSPNQMLCSNPWYTMFVTENGDVSICFLSEPIGNVFETPLIELWNSSAAVAKRSRMVAGRATKSGCSKLWCHWRDGTAFDPPYPDSWRELLGLFKALNKQLSLQSAPSLPDGIEPKLRNVRRLLDAKNRWIQELEANLSNMWEVNGSLHEAGLRHINELESQVISLQDKSEEI